MFKKNRFLHAKNDHYIPTPSNISIKLFLYKKKYSNNARKGKFLYALEYNLNNDQERLKIYSQETKNPEIIKKFVL